MGTSASLDSRRARSSATRSRTSTSSTAICRRPLSAGIPDLSLRTGRTILCLCQRALLLLGIVPVGFALLRLSILAPVLSCPVARAGRLLRCLFVLAAGEPGLLSGSFLGIGAVLRVGRLTRWFSRLRLAA